jgi:hypothetical protein
MIFTKTIVMKWNRLVAALSFVFEFSSFSCTQYTVCYSGGKIIKMRPNVCFNDTLLCVVMETLWKWKFYLSISTPLLCVIIKDVYTVYVQYTRKFLYSPVLNDTYLMIIWLFTKTNTKRTLNWACVKSENHIFQLM